MNIQFVFTLDQVNLVLKGLGKLPHEEVDPLVIGLRQAAIQALREHESNPPVNEAKK